MGTIKQRPVVAILVGGGPAPGINSVIGAATIRSILGGCDVIGIQDGEGLREAGGRLPGRDQGDRLQRSAANILDGQRAGGQRR